MNKLKTRQKIGVALILPVLIATGCKTVVRENIISSIETGIGVTLAENPKTEMYEVKIGYIRSQFYSVPTGKVVENEKPGNTNCCSTAKDKRSNRADRTPEVISGIRMSTSAKHLLLGVDVSENFAVGKVAVNSKAAMAMYIANADSDKKADAAAKATGRTFDPPTMNKMADINDLHNDGKDEEKQAIDEAVKGLSGKDWTDFVRSAEPEDWRQLTSILTKRNILEP